MSKHNLRSLIEAHHTAKRNHEHQKARVALSLIEERMYAQGFEAITIDGELPAPDVLPRNVVPFTFN